MPELDVTFTSGVVIAAANLLARAGGGGMIEGRRDRGGVEDATEEGLLKRRVAEDGSRPSIAIF